MVPGRAGGAKRRETTEDDENRSGLCCPGIPSDGRVSGWFTAVKGSQRFRASTPGPPSQGGSAGSNPVGATNKPPALTREVCLRYRLESAAWPDPSDQVGVAAQLRRSCLPFGKAVAPVQIRSGRTRCASPLENPLARLLRSMWRVSCAFGARWGRDRSDSGIEVELTDDSPTSRISCAGRWFTTTRSMTLRCLADP